MSAPITSVNVQMSRPDHLIHLKVRLAEFLQRELHKQSADNVSVLAERLDTDTRTVKELMALKIKHKSLAELRYYLLALRVPMQRIEACLLSQAML